MYVRRRLSVAVLLMFIIAAAVMLVRSLSDGDADDVNDSEDDSALETLPAVTDSTAPSSDSGGEPNDAADTGASSTPSSIESSTDPIVDALATDPTAPVVDAGAYAVYDLTADEWMSAANADTPRPVGSVIKLLTAYVVMQAGDPTKVVTIPDLDLNIEESQIGLFAGEQLQRDTLLRAMMIVSANDAAEALAVDIAGSEAQFVTMMNAAADQLGLDGTTAANASGLDARGAGSTARDVIELTDLLMADQTFRATVARRDAKLHGQTFPTTNELLTSYSGADGVKTGSTTQGGYSVVASATRNGRSVAVAVLGSPTDAGRFDAAADLLDWAFAQP
jgi:D-alanyl-D-alanine carboxypeptidase (penicillin-binding protein 5/6)